VLAVALAIECADELVDGAKGAALPLIRHDLGLSYGQVGLLASVPLIVGGLLELPLGVLTGAGRRRRLAILGGGVLFVLTLLAVALARSFAVLLAALIAFYPASGAFVSLSQAEVMDIWPDRQAQVMARWDLTGSAGAVAGPLLLTSVLASGGGWRAGYLALAGLAALTWVGACLRKPAAATGGDGGGGEEQDEDRPWGARPHRAARQRARRRAALPGLPARPRHRAQAGRAGRAERGHGAVVPGAPGPAVRQPAGKEFGGGDAEQRRGAGRRAGAAGGGAGGRGVRAELGVGRAGGRPGDGPASAGAW